MKIIGYTFLIVCLFALAIWLIEHGYLPKTGKTTTTTEVHYGTGTGDGRQGVVHSEETR